MQKFKKGTVVRIADDLGPRMNHFQKGCLAVVQYTYYSEYGGDIHTNSKQYGLYIEGSGTCAWYYEHQLTFVSDDGAELISKWEQERIDKEQKEILWENIYDLSPDQLPQYTVNYLWENVMGYGSIWGSSGEGFTAYINSQLVHEAYVYCKANSLGKENLPWCIQEFVRCYYEAENNNKS